MCKLRIKEKLFGRESNLQSFQITLGHPVQKPYWNKTLCSFPPSVKFFASVMPTRKNQRWEDRKYHNCLN